MCGLNSVPPRIFTTGILHNRYPTGISCFPHLRVSSVVEVVVVSKSKAIHGCKNLKSKDLSRSSSSVWLNSFFSQDILAC